MKTAPITKVVEPPKLLGRVPPNSLEAEAAILSACMLKPGAIDEVIGAVSPEDFYSEANANVFLACLGLASTSQPIDAVSVGNWLQDRDMLGKIGGPAHLGNILDLAPAVANVRQYATLVRQKRRIRRVIAEAQRVAAEGYGDIGDAEEWMADAEAALAVASGRDSERDGTEHIADALKRAWGDITARLEGNAPPGISTGLGDLDRCINFMRPGQVVVVGARSHVGKSSLARQIAGHVSGSTGGKPHGVFVWSGEQPNNELVECMNFQQAGMSEAKMRAMNLITRTDWSILTGVATGLSSSPFWVNDTPAIGPLKLQAAVRRWKREVEKRSTKEKTVKPALVVVDYVQLMSAQGLVERNANREREVSAISKKLKEMAIAENVVVMVLAQLNKGGEQRKDDTRPRPGDLRESNALEQDADKIILIHNPHAVQRMQAFRDGSNFELPTSEVVELIVGKARGGGTMGTVRALFFPGSAQFTDYRGE